MRKVLGIVFLSLFYCSFGLAECIEGNCNNGIGTFKIDQYQYTGDWKNSLPNGQGTLIFASGNKYTGGFKDGKYSSQGTYTG
jgi:hypothetical protein